MDSKWLLLTTLTALSLRAAAAEPGEDFTKEIRPILERHCFKCHGTEKKKADLDLHQFNDYAQVLEARDTWQLVLQRVQASEMPPASEPDLGYGKLEKLLSWLRKLPPPERPDCDQIASDRTASYYRGYVMSRRLNREEYNNTLRDLLGLEIDLKELLPADGGGGEGFDTAGSALFISSIHIEKYLAAADRALLSVLPVSTKNLPADVARARANILIARPSFWQPAPIAARVVIGAFAERAFRRPLDEKELDGLLTLFDRAYRRGDGFVAALRQALKAVLVSPNFLFLAEPEPAAGGIHRLEPLPLATKLSYFLWSSMPDQELFALARSGQLVDTNIYLQQVRRMLADPKAAALGERFALQWLNLDRLGTEVRPDPKAFPQFDPALLQAMRQEAILFFHHLLREDRSLLEVIDADYTFVNRRLAELYEIPNVATDTFQPVHLADRHRGGVLGMAAVHTLTSYPLRTSPVLRGRWIMEALLGEKVKPPPPDVPPLEENSEKAGPPALRAQLELHRAKAECAACHDKMDPLGFGLENFDVLGRWRSHDRGQPIDAQGQLSSGETYTGPDGLKKLLLKRKDDVVQNLVKKMIGYAYGRELNKFDDCVVERTMKALRENGYRATVLVEQIAVSYPFQHRFYPKETLAYDP